MNHIKLMRYSSGLRVHLFESTKSIHNSVILQNQLLGQKYSAKSLELEEHSNNKSVGHNVKESITTKEPEGVCLVESILNDFKARKIEQSYKTSNIDTRTEKGWFLNVLIQSVHVYPKVVIKSSRWIILKNPTSNSN